MVISSGDGRADYLCLEKDGRVTGKLNTASGIVDVGQVKFGEGWDRANMRFADVEASGRADLLHVDKYTGTTVVLKNNGRTPTGGSSFSWTNRGTLYSGIDRGGNMHFANFGGLGRVRGSTSPVRVSKEQIAPSPITASPYTTRLKMSTFSGPCRISTTSTSTSAYSALSCRRRSSSQTNRSARSSTYFQR